MAAKYPAQNGTCPTSTYNTDSCGSDSLNIRPARIRRGISYKSHDNAAAHCANEQPTNSYTRGCFAGDWRLHQCYDGENYDSTDAERQQAEKQAWLGDHDKSDKNDDSKDAWQYEAFSHQYRNNDYKCYYNDDW